MRAILPCQWQRVMKHQVWKSPPPFPSKQQWLRQVIVRSRDEDQYVRTTWNNNVCPTVVCRILSDDVSPTLVRTLRARTTEVSNWPLGNGSRIRGSSYHDTQSRIGLWLSMIQRQRTRDASDMTSDPKKTGQAQTSLEDVSVSYGEWAHREDDCSNGHRTEREEGEERHRDQRRWNKNCGSRHVRASMRTHGVRALFFWTALKDWSCMLRRSRFPACVRCQMRVTARAWNDATNYDPYCELFFFPYEVSARNPSSKTRERVFLSVHVQREAQLPAGNDHLTRETLAPSDPWRPRSSLCVFHVQDLHASGLFNLWPACWIDLFCPEEECLSVSMEGRVKASHGDNPSAVHWEVTETRWMVTARWNVFAHTWRRCTDSQEMIVELVRCPQRSV